MLDKEGRLPLHYAAISGELSVVILLLEKEEQLRTMSTDDKLTVSGEYSCMIIEGALVNVFFKVTLINSVQPS